VRIDLRTVDRHPLASVGALVLRPTVLVVSGLRGNAEVGRPLYSAASQTPERRSMKTFGAG
jgi:hypothetical protein